MMHAYTEQFEIAVEIVNPEWSYSHGFTILRRENRNLDLILGDLRGTAGEILNECDIRHRVSSCVIHNIANPVN